MDSVIASRSVDTPSTRSPTTNISFEDAQSKHDASNNPHDIITIIQSPLYVPNKPPVTTDTWTVLLRQGGHINMDILELWGDLQIRGAITAEVLGNLDVLGKSSTNVRFYLVQCVLHHNVDRNRCQDHLKDKLSALISDDVLRALSIKLMLNRNASAGSPGTAKTPEHQLKVLCGALAAAHGYDSFASWFRPVVSPLLAGLTGDERR
jgi:hypothetical protein